MTSNYLSFITHKSTYFLFFILNSEFYYWKIKEEKLSAESKLESSTYNSNNDNKEDNKINLAKKINKKNEGTKKLFPLPKKKIK